VKDSVLKSFSKLRVMIVGSLLLAAGSVPIEAAKVHFLKIESRASLLAGTLEGVSVDSLGRLQLADEIARVADIEEPFLFSGVRSGDGWILGTGNSGRVLRVDRDGNASILFEAAEPEIFAVHADPDGTLFVGSSPSGKVYRIVEGEATEFFDPGETYIWQIARAADGDLLVATGTEGKVYRVDAAGQGSVFYDSEDTHVRALAVEESGRVLLGTAGNGLVLAIDSDGRTRTLYDSPHAEVVAFATAPNGDSYAALLSSEASLANLNARADDAKKDDESDDSDEEESSVKVTTDTEKSAPAYTGSRPQGFGGPRSELLRISDSGTVESVGRFEDETIYDLAWRDDRLWIATGLEGRLYSLRDDETILESSVDERQIVVLLDDDHGPAFASTNAAAVFRFQGRTTRTGTYTSAALDAGQISRFGSLRWRGGADGKVGFSFRSGMSQEPDATWSDWSDWFDGREISLSGVPEGRYIQWRAELKARADETMGLGDFALSYRQVNLPPRIESVTVLAPGEILVPQNFNPGNQTFEVTNKSRSGIFSTLGRVQLPPDKRGKTLWKQGFRTLRWSAKDANEDRLTYTLSFRAEGSDRWLPMVDDLKMNFYSFDTTVLPDGNYRFEVRASDTASNQDGEELTVRDTSELVRVDNTPPTVARRTRDGARIRIVIEDALSPMRTAELSVDAAGWKEAIPEDGILDGTKETFLFDPPEPGSLMLFRVIDESHNVTTVDLSGGSN